MRNQYRFTIPPKILTRPDIQLDNFSLVSANLLLNMRAYRAVMVLPSPMSALRRVYAAIAQALKQQRMTVRRYGAT